MNCKKIVICKLVMDILDFKPMLILPSQVSFFWKELLLRETRGGGSDYCKNFKYYTNYKVKYKNNPKISLSILHVITSILPEC